MMRRGAEPILVVVEARKKGTKRESCWEFVHFLTKSHHFLKVVIYRWQQPKLCQGCPGLGSTIHVFHHKDDLIELHLEGFIFATYRIGEVKHHVHQFLRVQRDAKDKGKKEPKLETARITELISCLCGETNSEVLDPRVE